MDLRSYERAKFGLAEILREVGGLAKDGPCAERVRELFVRLAEDRFNLVVAGRFSRGKSSLMNAVMGMDRLPTGVVPVTSVITSVSYGSRAQVIVRFRGHRLGIRVPFESLPEYVSEGLNPGNVRNVVQADIRLPSEILRRGFHFIDTPGLGSVNLANTRTAEAFLPEADAFIVVTSHESPLSGDELEVCRMAESKARPAFVVINKQDLVPDEQRRQTILYVRQQLDQRLGSRSAVFSVSAKEGMSAKLGGEAQALESSGIPQLEAAIGDVLLADKEQGVLRGTRDRTLELLDELPEDARHAFRDRIGKWWSGLATDRAPAAGSSGRLPLAAAPGRPFDRCAICAAVSEEVFRFISRYQYALSTDRALQERHAAQGGFCPHHTWRYASNTSSYAICTAYPRLLEQLSAELRAKDGDPSHAAARTCPACAAHEAAERAALREFAERSAAGRPQGTCVPHLRQLAGLIDDITLRTRLMDEQAAALERLAEDMGRYATKRDALRSSLLSDEESEVADRALAAVAGVRDLKMS